LKPAGKFYVFDVKVCDDFSIPPFSECLVCMKVDGNSIEKFGMFCPLKDKLVRLGVIGAQSVSIAKNGLIPVRLINASDREQKFCKNYICGTFEIELDNTKKHHHEIVNSLEAHAKTADDLTKIYDTINDFSWLNEDQKQHAVSLIKKFECIFAKDKNDIGFCTDIEHEIKLKENAPVQRINSKVPYNVEEWVDRQVEQLRSANIIRESSSPWAAPIVVVKKKNGEFRMCIDYRRLNSLTVRPIYNIPDSSGIFYHISDSTFFSTIDVSSAYHQCPIKESDKHLTAFTTRNGQFEFNRMPFGLCGAPFTFQRLMTSVLRDQNWLTCLIYLDDIVVFSRTFEEHVQRLSVIFGKIREAGLKLSPAKCKFFSPEVKYLGHVISKDGLKTDPEKICALKKWPLPDSVCELRKFLGFCNY